jgi:hypothetical protein
MNVVMVAMAVKKRRRGIPTPLERRLSRRETTRPRGTRIIKSLRERFPGILASEQERGAME